MGPGGETVFPYVRSKRSKHALERFPWLIRNASTTAIKRFETACSGELEALRVPPTKGSAIFFESVRGLDHMPIATLDLYTFHGACPLLKGANEKWTAQIWQWQRVGRGASRGVEDPYADCLHCRDGRAILPDVDRLATPPSEHIPRVLLQEQSSPPLSLAQHQPIPARPPYSHDLEL